MEGTMETIYFLTIGEHSYSRSWTYYSELKSTGQPVEFIRVRTSGLIPQFLQLRKRIPRNSLIVVMSPSQYLTLFIKVFISRRIILDAGWALFEGTAISRGVYGFLYHKALKAYVIDFIASHLATITILESNLQKIYYSKLFLLNIEKCKVLYTGLDEKAFCPDSNLVIPPDIFKNKQVVLFRGKFNPEAGMETLAEATRLLEDYPITFWVYSPGIPSAILFSANTIVNSNFISKSHIATLQGASALTLGQLANHVRLKRTIPHKAFESAFLSSPYLTARSIGIQELFTEDIEIACFEPGSAEDLADCIKKLLENKLKLSSMSTAMKSTYNLACSQAVLANKFSEIVRSNFV